METQRTSSCYSRIDEQRIVNEINTLTRSKKVLEQHATASLGLQSEKNKLKESRTEVCLSIVSLYNQSTNDATNPSTMMLLIIIIIIIVHTIIVTLKLPLLSPQLPLLSTHRQVTELNLKVMAAKREEAACRAEIDALSGPRDAGPKVDYKLVSDGLMT